MNTRDTYDFPVARIDAQDESYILPLREYLETHGVAVSVNHTPKTHPLYHIVAGDATYVKQIFSRLHEHGVKRLGIVLGGGVRQEEFSGNYKIVTAGPALLSNEEVVQVFEFFFTEGKKHIHIGVNRENRTVHEQDQARVSSILLEMYKKQNRPRAHKRRWILAILMAAGLFILPTIWYTGSMLLGGAAIASGARAMQQGNFQVLPWHTRVAEYWTHQAAFVLDMATIPLRLAGKEDMVRGQQRLVSFMKDAADAEKQAGPLATVAKRVATGFISQGDAAGNGTTAASDILQLRIALYTLGNSLGLAQAEFSMLVAQQTFPFSLKEFSKRGRSAIDELATIRQSTGDMDKLLLLFLSLAGFKEPRTYLVLLQNSMELRPTGGFIGSVAVASFADGRLTNLDIQDVYTFDGQLKGHVDPPLPIKELLAQEHWYLRDSNWDPDFKESGTRAAWFYEKETGAKVDGVIALSTPFIINLLTATGPIELSDYKDRITAENFYGKSIYYTQNDFFPGSTQKKDFLGSLSRTMVTTITTGTNVNTTKLFQAITTALAGHDILLMFMSPELQSLVDHYAWSGRVPSQAGCTGTGKSTCVFDPLVAVEANLGVNKVNYFVTRTIARTITIREDGTRTQTIELVLRNGSGDEEQNMKYHAYVRFVMPAGSSVDDIMIDGNSVKPDTSTIASGKFTVGIPINVPASSEKRVSLSYTDNQPILFGVGGAVMDIFTQKQPGVSNTPLHTVIRYPKNWTAGVESRDFIAKQGQLEYNTILTRDDLTRIRFTK